MDNFRYVAKDEKGKNVKGFMQAENEADLHARLKADGKLLVSSSLVKEKKNTKRIKTDKISDFSRNIGKLVGAGVPLIKALRIIVEDETLSPKEKEIYTNILKQVRSGMTLSDSMYEQGNAFPPLFINMFKSAETTGNIEQVASQLADYYKKEDRLNKKIKGAMTYPKVLGCLLVIVLIIIMTYVIPQFSDLFAKMDKLPGPTVFLLTVSDFFKRKWYVVIFCALVIYLVLKLLLAIPAVKYFFSKLEVHLPIVGKLRKTIYTARFARTLSSLYSAGIPIINCLHIARNTIGSVYIENQFDMVISDVRAGLNLSEAIDKVDGFTKKLAATTKVGEETGKLDTMLVSTADQLDYEAEIAMGKFVGMLEPVMIIIMGVIVGFIMISVINPIYGSYKAISNSAK